MFMESALITGCSSGIGHALAIEFASRGLQVIATARTKASLRSLEEAHPNIKALPLDVRISNSIKDLHLKVHALTGGKLKYLVNNAGTHYACPSIELERERVRMLFETNVFGVMDMCHTFSDLLLNGRGTIVQIGSVTRNVPVVWQSSYNASKAALSQYTKTMRLELEPFGVKVCEVVTGFVQSNILREGLESTDNSLYLPIRDHVVAMKYDGNRNGTPPDEYARRVVNRILCKDPPFEIWEGAQSWLLHFIVTWLPNWCSHRIWWSTFRLKLLRR